MQIYRIAIILMLLLASPSFAYTVHLMAPAVILNADQGVLTTVYLNVTPGTGVVKVSVPNGTVANDTIGSADNATGYAAIYTHTDKNRYNFSFSITNSGSNVSGPSAGLAFTLLSIAGLEHTQLFSNFTVTGTISPNGDVGLIGGAYDKIQVASEMNESFILVPYASNSTFEYLIYYLSQQADGIPVVQVSNVTQAVPYAFGDKAPSPLQYNITANYNVSRIQDANAVCPSCNQSTFANVSNYTFSLVSQEIGLINSSSFSSVKSQLEGQLAQYRALNAKGYLYSAADLAFVEFPTAFVFANYNASNKASAGAIVQNITEYCNAFNYTPQMTTTNYEYVVGGEVRRAWALNALADADQELNTSQSSDDVLSALDEAAPAYSWCAATGLMFNISASLGGSPVGLPANFTENVSRQLAYAQVHYGSLDYVKAARYDYDIGDYAAALYSIAYADVFYGNRSDLSYNASTVSSISALVNSSMASTNGVWPIQFSLESSFYLNEAEISNSNATGAAFLDDAYSTAALANQISIVNSEIQRSFVAAAAQPQSSSSAQLSQLKRQNDLILGALLVILMIVFGIFLLPRQQAVQTKNAKSDSRFAGYLLIAASLQFIIAMIVVQYSYACSSGGICYNPGTNPISDLGNTQTSVLWPVFNYSLVIFGALVFAGLLLLRDSFPRGKASSLGIVVLLISILFSMGVGVVPENTILVIHSYLALFSFIGSGLGILLIGIGMRNDKRLGKYCLYSVISGLFSLVLVVIFMLPLFGLHSQWPTSGSGFGFGTIERLVLAPVILWLIVMGIYFVFSKPAVAAKQSKGRRTASAPAL